MPVKGMQQYSSVGEIGGENEDKSCSYILISWKGQISHRDRPATSKLQ